MLSILYYLKNADPLVTIIIIISRCFVVFCCMPVHELAHALMADRLGDDTARLKGRLTINPFAHLDLLGTIMIFLVGIGYANPVPVNPRRLKHPRRDMALIALAGPAANLICAFVAVFVSCALAKFAGDSVAINAVGQVFYYAAVVNVSLAVFNLFPIPPLDGSKVLAAVLPDKIYFKYMKYERYIMIALMVLVFSNVLNTPISYVSAFFMRVISFIPNLIFGV